MAIVPARDIAKFFSEKGQLSVISASAARKKALTRRPCYDGYQFCQLVSWHGPRLPSLQEPLDVATALMEKEALCIHSGFASSTC